MQCEEMSLQTVAVSGGEVIPPPGSSGGRRSSTVGTEVRAIHVAGRNVSHILE